MSKTPRNPEAAKKQVERDERLRAALRENLKRRKAQTRGRGADDKAAGDAQKPNVEG
ncbi:MAG: hypothetical protein AAGJ34_06245 [Pseudomonadota bacterium]